MSDIIRFIACILSTSGSNFGGNCFRHPLERRSVLKRVPKHHIVNVLWYHDKLSSVVSFSLYSLHPLIRILRSILDASLEGPIAESNKVAERKSLPCQNEK
jgi:hypothetical protein